MLEPPVEVGEVLADKYRIERVLGHGGMGVVAAARHLELDELVAIKFLLPKALEHPSLVARFSLEAKAQVKVKSEHVARTIDVGKLASGAPYMVLEYLEGSDLASLLKKRGRIEPMRAVDWLLQAAEALSEAHALGIVHRDLKPANLFITQRSDGSECVKVLDFGISKFTSDAGGGGDLDLTRTNMMLGSPLYMSPEQLRSAKDVDARADVWSLGVILYEMLAGSVPFYEDTIAQLCVSVMLKPLPNIQAAAPAVPDALRAVVERAATKDPDARFSSVAEFAAALAPFGSEEAERSLQRIRRLASRTLMREGGEPTSEQAVHHLADTTAEGRATLARSREMARLVAEAQRALELTHTPAVADSFSHGETIQSTAHPTPNVKNASDSPPLSVLQTFDGVVSRQEGARLRSRRLVLGVASLATAVGAAVAVAVALSQPPEGSRAVGSGAPEQVAASASSPLHEAQSPSRKPSQAAGTSPAEPQEQRPPESAAMDVASGPILRVRETKQRAVPKARAKGAAPPPAPTSNEPAIERAPTTATGVYGDRE